MLDRVFQDEFRSFIQIELVKRCKANPRYSLRAYSKALGIQSSFLSKLLTGKRAITTKTIERLAEPLGLNPVECNKFMGKGRPSDSMGHLIPVERDAFQAISDWYHFAILELFTIEGFKPTSAYISRRLGINRILAMEALARLERLGFIKKHLHKGYVLIKGENTTLKTNASPAVLKKLQRQVLEMAIQALEDVPACQRSQSTMTMAIDPKLLPQAREYITEFRRNLCEFLQKNRTTCEVYQLTISLYPVTKLEYFEGTGES